MKKVICSIISVLAVVILSAGMAMAEEQAINVKLYQTEGLGELYLADGKSMTLYFFLNDSPGVSNCTGECVSNWPLFYIEKPAPGPRLSLAGYKASDFSTVSRADGKMQTAFKGWPLYYFVKDQKPGDIMGRGVKNVWILAIPQKLPSKK